MREVWFWQDGEIHVYVLANARYERSEASVLVPGLDSALVARLVELPTVSEAVRALREALRGRVH